MASLSPAVYGFAWTAILLNIVVGISVDEDQCTQEGSCFMETECIRVHKFLTQQLFFIKLAGNR